MRGIGFTFFSDSLIVIRNNVVLKASLGEPIIGWYDPTFRFIDEGKECMALVQYSVKSPKDEALIKINAQKIDKRRWDCFKITATIKSNRKQIEI